MQQCSVRYVCLRLLNRMACARLAPASMLVKAECLLLFLLPCTLTGLL